jgi:hypothetical protein
VLHCGRQGKIADLEYAKALNSTDESHDVRTEGLLTSWCHMHLIYYVLKGTANFMACEVEAQRYLFLPFDDFMISDFEAGRRPFHFNPLHDLESWWWIPNWVLHFHVDNDTQTLPPDHDEIYQFCFPGLTPPLGASCLTVLYTPMEADTFPTSFHTTVVQLEVMHRTILKCYQEADHTFPMEYQEPSMKLCQFMLESIQEARKAVKSVTLKPSHHVGKHQAEHGSLPTAKRRKDE